MKKILVTGGAGFVGSHLCTRLLNDHNKVVCVDNLKTGKIDNIEELTHNPNFTFIYRDITNGMLDMAYYKFDEIFNLACPASPIHYQNNPIHTTMTSVLGSYNVLNLAKECGAKVLQSSTSEVYGNPTEHPQSENYFGNVNPDGIRSCYDEGKRCAESLFFDFNRMYNVDVRIVRIFNTYGENMDVNDGRVVSNFITQALNGDNITIYGDGSQTRSFQYVSDLVDGMILMMNSNFHGPVNIGNPEEYTILELAKKIIKMTNSSSKITYLPLPSDDPVVRKPNIELAKRQLGWAPKVNINVGLLKTIKYFDGILGKHGNSPTPNGK